MRYPNIEAERARAGMTKETLAQSIGISRKTLHNWVVSGNIPLFGLEKMAEIFGCSVDYLLGRNVS